MLKKQDLRSQILTLLQAGKSRPYVVKKLGCCNAIVYRVASENGLAPNAATLEPDDANLIEALFEAGMSRKEVCEKFEVNKWQLKAFCVKHGIDLPDARKNLPEERKEDLRNYAKLQRKTLNGKHVSPKARKVLEMGLKGFDEYHIAKEVGCKTEYVNRILAVHNVKKCVKVEDAKAKVARAAKYPGNLARNVSAIFGLSIGQAYSCIKLAESQQ